MWAPAWRQGQGSTCCGRELAICGSQPPPLGCWPNITGVHTEGALEEEVIALVSQVRKLRPGEAQGMLADMESEALLLCCTLKGGGMALISATRHGQKIQMGS